MDSKKNQTSNKLSKKKVVAKKRKISSLDKSPAKVSHKRAKTNKNVSDTANDVQLSQNASTNNAGVPGVYLNNDDLNSIVEKVTLSLAGKFQNLMGSREKSSPEADLVVQNDDVLLQDKPNFQSKDSDVNGSPSGENCSHDTNHNNGNSEAAVAKAKADALMLELSRFKEASKRDDSIKPNNDGQYLFTLNNGQNVQLSAGQLENFISNQPGSTSVTKEVSNNGQFHGFNPHSDSTRQHVVHLNKSPDLPNFGAFGEIKHKSSLLAVNSINDNPCHWHEEGCQNRQPRLLKSGLNRSYNDLVVRELIWPNDLVLRGSKKVKLLDMSHSEFFLAIIKTIAGTLHDCPQNINTANLLKYFNGMFRDA